ncbi:MAG TPA: LysR substrate-binding domain-containing protein [Caulobacteraceae bacterium]|jgi:LysR family cys regulon transcriptional activator|nr:LysR substrate-binding domain-containing protein [Caulobacteraceae bacterium]
MRLEQLRFLSEIVDQGFSISKAAIALNTSQPGISKQIRLLEEEFKFDLLQRRGGRIVGLTEPGVAFVETARRMLRDAGNLRKIGDEYNREDSGRLVVVTTHLYARHVLPPVLEAFARRYPRVQISLQQVTQRQTIELLVSFKGDVGILSAPPAAAHGVVELAAQSFGRSVIVPRNHPLLKRSKIGLADLVEYPLVTLDPSLIGGWSLQQAFAKAGMEPRIALTAGDSDVIKAYVARGLGITVLPSIVFDAKQDPLLRAIDADHLFEKLPNFVALHPHTYLSGYMYDFIQLVAPEWTPDRVAKRLKQPHRPA